MANFGDLIGGGATTVQDPFLPQRPFADPNRPIITPFQGTTELAPIPGGQGFSPIPGKALPEDFETKLSGVLKALPDEGIFSLFSEIIGRNPGAQYLPSAEEQFLDFKGDRTAAEVWIQKQIFAIAASQGI